MSFTNKPVSPDKPTKINLEGVNKKFNKQKIDTKGVSIGFAQTSKATFGGSQKLIMEKDPYAMKKMKEFKKALSK